MLSRGRPPISPRGHSGKVLKPSCSCKVAQTLCMTAVYPSACAFVRSVSVRPVIGTRLSAAINRLKLPTGRFN